MIRRLIVLATALAAILAGGMTQARPAMASTGTVWVENHASAYWPVSSAKSYVDQYTGTTFVFGPCHPGQPCIFVNEVYVRSNWVAVTYPGLTTYVFVNPRDRWYSWSAKYNTLIHELAHARGVEWHTYTCNNVMYWQLRCPNGYLRPRTFTAYQRYTLGWH